MTDPFLANATLASTAAWNAASTIIPRGANTSPHQRGKENQDTQQHLPLTIIPTHPHFDLSSQTSSTIVIATPPPLELSFPNALESRALPENEENGDGQEMDAEHEEENDDEVDEEEPEMPPVHDAHRVHLPTPFDLSSEREKKAWRLNLTAQDPHGCIWYMAIGQSVWVMPDRILLKNMPSIINAIRIIQLGKDLTCLGIVDEIGTCSLLILCPILDKCEIRVDETGISTWGLCGHASPPLIATSANDRVIRIYPLHTGERMVLKGHTNNIPSISFSSDGQHLVSCSIDESVRIWRVATGECVRVIYAIPREWCWTVTCIPDHTLPTLSYHHHHHIRCSSLSRQGKNSEPYYALPAFQTDNKWQLTAWTGMEYLPIYLRRERELMNGMSSSSDDSDLLVSTSTVPLSKDIDTTPTSSCSGEEMCDAYDQDLGMDMDGEDDRVGTSDDHFPEWIHVLWRHHRPLKHHPSNELNGENANLTTPESNFAGPFADLILLTTINHVYLLDGERSLILDQLWHVSAHDMMTQCRVYADYCRLSMTEYIPSLGCIVIANQRGRVLICSCFKIGPSAVYAPRRQGERDEIGEEEVVEISTSHRLVTEIWLPGIEFQVTSPLYGFFTRPEPFGVRLALVYLDGIVLDYVLQRPTPICDDEGVDELSRWLLVECVPSHPPW